MAIDTTIVINSISYDNVIVVNDYFRPALQPRILSNTNYYAKNIGLIRVDKYLNDTTMFIGLLLESYFINY